MSLTKTNIQKYIKNTDTSYKIFDIKYTEKEKQTIDNFKINNQIFFSYYGIFNENTLMNGDYYKNNIRNIINIIDFLYKIGNNTEKDIKIIKAIIYKLINKITKSYDKNYIWLDIRSRLPNKEFDITRWHTDGFENQTKFITLLKGPSTLFIDDKDIKSKKTYFEIIDKIRKEINKFIEKNGVKIGELDKINNKYRKVFDIKLKDAKIIQPNNNQGVIYKTDLPKNNNKLMGIHSEPINDKPRFFISVMCGTKEEINKIAEIRKPKST